MPGRFISASFLIAFALAAPAAAGVKEGVEKWQAGDYKAAVVEWLPFAAKGDADALFNMGQAYKLGRGVPLDKAKAEDFYRRAAEKGHAPAQSNLGILLAQRGEKVAAAELWQKAAAKRDARAQYMLGVLHFNGDTLPKNWPLAYAYMMQANNAGLPQAGRALSTMNANMPEADRSQGTEMANAMMTGDRLASSGKALPGSRKLSNGIAANTASKAPAGPADKAPVPVPAVKPIALKPAPSPARTVVATAEIPAPRATAVPGGWRIQLGAFSQEARAREAWSALKRDHPALVAGLEPAYNPGGSMIRLQVGGFASAAEANAVCQRLRNTGSACFATQAN